MQKISTLPLKESPEAAWKVCFKIIDWFQPLRFLLQWLLKGCSWLRCLFIVKPRDGNKRQPATKRLGTVAQILFAIIPVRFQLALGFLHSMCQSIEVEETLKSPVTPSMRGSKRKKEEDAVLDEPQCWIETILKDLPDNDDSEDTTYEPTKSETDSEEYKSQNDTEGDLEYEEKDGLVMLKEDPISTGQNGEGTTEETPQTADVREELVASRTSGDDHKYPEHCLLTSRGICSLKSLESTEIMATSIQGSDTVDSNDSEDVWTEVSCPGKDFFFAWYNQRPPSSVETSWSDFEPVTISQLIGWRVVWAQKTWKREQIMYKNSDLLEEKSVTNLT
ncbi:uncharacterized protein LOC117680053 isoform X2 [Pantherophis guttatus]|uniref:Uncharacterized protein LOC117680053 isoform X2 n=1 Tax=Pantherophis guttatus TaxID=94885 RepID=A0A6P9DRI2_PANGU|nr:uncharacterized protein LOC117680053 isoform X2 [Pantherophis guttatus]